MILPPNTVSGPRGRALATRKPVRIQPGRQRTVRVNALFGFGGGSSGGSNEAVLELVNSKFRGPSEAGNEAVAEAAASFGRVNKNPRSKDLYGKWGIVYASGNTGLTALDGKISKFVITDDGAYENECSSRIAGIFPGSAKEGGKLKVTGGNKFELLQEYRELSRPGGSSYEEVEDAPVRSFEVLALTDGALVMRLAATTFLDDDTGKRVTQTPEGEYYLVWRKEGAATAVAAVEEDSDIEKDVQHFERTAQEEDEDMQRVASGSIFSGLFGGKQSSSLATVAEKNLGGGNSRAQALDAQRSAAQSRQQAAVDRRAAAQADKERRREEASARKQQQQQRQQEAADESTEVVTKPLFAFGGFGGTSKKVVEEISETTGVSVQKGFGGFFGSQNRKKTESAPARGAAAADPAEKRRQAAEARKQEAEDKKERARQEAEERKRAQDGARATQAAEREEKKREAEAKKQEDAQRRQQEADMRKRINDVVSEMQNDTRDAALEVREQSTQLRTAERTGASAMRAGSAAERQLQTAESAFAKAEGGLADANGVFNDIAGKLKTKQSELNAARSEARKLEDNLLKKY